MQKTDSGRVPCPNCGDVVTLEQLIARRDQLKSDQYKRDIQTWMNANPSSGTTGLGPFYYNTTGTAPVYTTTSTFGITDWTAKVDCSGDQEVVKETCANCGMSYCPSAQYLRNKLKLEIQALKEDLMHPLELLAEAMDAEEF